MYRIEASCRKHSTCHSQLTALVRKYKWNIAIEDKICQINADFISRSEARASKQMLQTDLYALERQIKPALPYGMIFSNTFWIGTRVDNEQ